MTFNYEYDYDTVDECESNLIMAKELYDLIHYQDPKNKYCVMLEDYISELKYIIKSIGGFKIC